MAMVILFGLLTSTALNMIVVPALYLRFGRIGPGVPAAHHSFNPGPLEAQNTLSRT
jgi:hypothetical protein